MALIWAEPFDQYGGTSALVSTFGYSDVAIANVTATGRTGARACQINNGMGLKKALDTPVADLGQGVAFNLVSGPGSNNYQNAGFRFESTGKVLECSVVAMPDLSLAVYDRTQTLKGQTPPNQLIIGSYVWVEAKITGNIGAVINTGTVEVRVNGVTKLIVNGINLPNLIAYHGLLCFNTTNCIFDDWIVWDTTGIRNNDFMGDRRLYMSLTDANGALQNFTPVPAGNAFDRINNVPPIDTEYIEGAAAGNISEFTKSAIGIASTDIAAVAIFGRLFKSDAGVASGRLGINSVGNVANSAELFPGTTGAWYKFIQETDPNGNVSWTRAAADAALVRITRAS